MLSSSRLAASFGVLQQPEAQVPDFGRQVEDILAFLRGTFTASDGTELHATARELASTYGHWTHSIRSGHGAVPYPDPATTPPLIDDERAVVEDRLITQFVGLPSTVADRLDSLRRVTAADEPVVTSVTHKHADRLRSYELIAREWGLKTLRAG